MQIVWRQTRFKKLKLTVQTAGKQNKKSFMVLFGDFLMVGMELEGEGCCLPLGESTLSHTI